MSNVEIPQSGGSFQCANQEHVLSFIAGHRKLFSRALKAVWNWDEEGVAQTLMSSGILEYAFQNDPGFMELAKKFRASGKIDQRTMVRLRQMAKSADYFAAMLLPLVSGMVGSGAEMRPWQEALALVFGVVSTGDSRAAEALVSEIEKTGAGEAEAMPGRDRKLFGHACNLVLLWSHQATLDYFIESWRRIIEYFRKNDVLNELDSFEQAELFFSRFIKSWCFIRKRAFQYFRMVKNGLRQSLDGENGERLADALAEDCRSFGCWLNAENGAVIREVFSAEISNLFEGMEAEDSRALLDMFEPPLSERDKACALAELDSLGQGKIAREQSFLLRIILPLARGEKAEAEIEDIDGECLYSVSLFSKLAKGGYRLNIPEKAARKPPLLPEAREIGRGQAVVAEQGGDFSEAEKRKISQSFIEDCQMSAFVRSWNQRFTEAEIALLDNIGGLRGILSAQSERRFSNPGERGAGETDKSWARTLASAAAALCDADCFEGLLWLWQDSEVDRDLAMLLHFGCRDPLHKDLPGFAGSLASLGLDDGRFLLMMIALARPALLAPQKIYADIFARGVNIASKHGFSWLCNEIAATAVSGKSPENMGKLQKALKKADRKFIERDYRGRMLSRRVEEVLRGAAPRPRPLLAPEIWGTRLKSAAEAASGKWRGEKEAAAAILEAAENGYAFEASSLLESDPKLAAIRLDGGSLAEAVSEKAAPWLALSDKIYSAAKPMCAAMFAENPDKARILGFLINAASKSPAPLLRILRRAGLFSDVQPSALPQGLDRQPDAPGGSEILNAVRNPLESAGFFAGLLSGLGAGGVVVGGRLREGEQAAFSVEAKNLPPGFGESQMLLLAERAPEGFWRDLHAGGLLDRPAIALVGENVETRGEIAQIAWEHPLCVIDERARAFAASADDPWFGLLAGTGYNPVECGGESFWLERLGAKSLFAQCLEKALPDERKRMWKLVFERPGGNPLDIVFDGMAAPNGVAGFACWLLLRENSECDFDRIQEVSVKASISPESANLLPQVLKNLAELGVLLAKGDDYSVASPRCARLLQAIGLDGKKEVVFQ